MNKLTAFRTAKSTGLFEQDNSKDRLVKMGNPMENITRIFDFETFRATLEGLLFTKERKSNAGRRPIDCVMMFKVLFLQRYYGLSDEQTEYQIVDRGSFRRFVGIENVDDVPDARTIWKYREELTKANAYDKLFDEFTEMLRQKGYELNKGQMIDASFVVGTPATQHAGREPEDKGREWGRTMERHPPQEEPQGHRRTLDEKKGGDLLRLQEPHQGRREAQVRDQI